LTLRRRRLPPELAEPYAAFEHVAALLGEAKDALTAVMPTTRLPGTPLAEALEAFEDRLARASAGMEAWRVPEVMDAWGEATRGLERARERARAFREDPPELAGFEGLIWAVGEVLDPLEAFEIAEDRFRALRVRSR
jgi:hypothetical protein